MAQKCLHSDPLGHMQPLFHALLSPKKIIDVPSTRNCTEYSLLHHFFSITYPTTSVPMGLMMNSLNRRPFQSYRYLWTRHIPSKNHVQPVSHLYRWCPEAWTQEGARGSRHKVRRVSQATKACSWRPTRIFFLQRQFRDRRQEASLQRTHGIRKETRDGRQGEEQKVPTRSSLQIQSTLLQPPHLNALRDRYSLTLFDFCGFLGKGHQEQEIEGCFGCPGGKVQASGRESCSC